MAKRPGKPQVAQEKGLTSGPSLDSGMTTFWGWEEAKKVKVSRKPSPTVVILPAEERVAKGASWLDIREPSWFRRVDPDRLDVGSVQGCPLAMSFPDDEGRPSFRLGCRYLCGRVPNPQFPGYFKLVDENKIRTHGFTVPVGASPDDDLDLNRCWKLEVRKRREAAIARSKAN